MCSVVITRWWCWCCCLLGIQIHGAYSDILEDIFAAQNYDSNLWPTFETPGNATAVNVTLYINSFGSINAAHMEYTVDVFLRQFWNDPRLKFKPKESATKSMTFNKKETLDRLWKPDMYFYNVKESEIHTVTVPNLLFRIYPDGLILYSMRLTLRMSCHMWLHSYPFDTQKCKMIMGSYAYSDDILVFHWQKHDPISLSPTLELPQFDLTHFDTEDNLLDVHESGNYSKLHVNFHLHRHNGYHVVQTYLPTIIIVAISWVSFWLDPGAIPGRVTLGVTTLLTLTTVASGVRTQLPPVGYIKAIDVWIGTCMVFVFGALFEFTVVNYLSRRKFPDRNSEDFNMKTTARGELEQVPKIQDSSPKTKISLAKKVDRLSRFIFPISFILFNGVYWLVYVYPSI